MPRDFSLSGPDLRAFARRMEHAGFSAKKELRGIHRKWSRVLAKDIKVAMPKTGSRGGKGSRKLIAKAHKRSGWKKTGSAHNTPRGAMARSVKTWATTGSAGVTGGDARAPHYAVNEFGGAVWWTKKKRTVPKKRLHTSYAKQRARSGGKLGHIIPVRLRSPAFNRGVTGWFFYPTIYEKLDTIEHDYFTELDHHVTSELKKLSYRKQ